MNRPRLPHGSGFAIAFFPAVFVWVVMIVVILALCGVL